jgi:nonribosomal peptide synthetase DhbF
MHGAGELPLQYLGDPADFPFSLVDVTSAADPEAAAKEWIRADISRPVDLFNGPLTAYVLFKVAPKQFLWFMRIQHIAIDGLGAWMFAQRAAAIYTALLSGASPEGATPEPYRVLLEAEARYRGSAGFTRDRDFWTETLAGFAGAASISGRPGHKDARPPVRCWQHLDAGEAAAVRAAAPRYSISDTGERTSPGICG